MSDVAERFGALSREFLTWLWFEAERNNGRVELQDVVGVGVEFARRLTLESPGVMREGHTISADAPAEAQEARTALQMGKKVASTRMLLHVGERVFELSVAAETFVFSGVKLPTLLAAGEEERLAERLALIEELEALVDGLYVQYARLRLDEPRWSETRAAMVRWIRDAGSEGAVA